MQGGVLAALTDQQTLGQPVAVVGANQVAGATIRVSATRSGGLP